MCKRLPFYNVWGAPFWQCCIKVMDQAVISPDQLLLARENPNQIGLFQWIYCTFGVCRFQPISLYVCLSSRCSKNLLLLLQQTDTATRRKLYVRLDSTHSWNPHTAREHCNRAQIVSWVACLPAAISLFAETLIAIPRVPPKTV